MDKNNIISWNCDGFFSHFNEFQIVCQDFNPIFFCVQETKFKFDYKPDRIGKFNCFSKNFQAANNVAQGGVLILINENYYATEFPLNSDFQAIAVKVFFPIEFVLCCLYIPNSKCLTKNQLNNLIAQLGPNFMIVTDPNAHNLIWGSNKDDPRGKIFEDAINENNLIILNDGSQTHFSFGYKTFSAIDLTLISHTLATHFDWCVAEDLYGSDHFPIIISVLSSTIKETRRPKWVFKRADWKLFQEKINFDENLNFCDINEHYKYIASNIINAAKISIPKTSTVVPKKCVPWWSDEARNILRKKKRLLRKFNRTARLIDYRNFLAIKVEARKLIQNLKRKCWINYVSKITTNTTSSEVFSKLRQLSGKFKSSQITSLSINGQLITQRDTICEEMANFFQSISSSGNYNIEFQNFKALKEQETLFIPDGSMESYNAQFSFEEMENCLVDCKGSSPGPDEISYEIIKNLNYKSKIFLLKFYNKLWEINILPEAFTHAIVISIAKDGKDSKLPENYRPISLTNCLCKLMERMINKRLVWFCEANNILSNYQSGFRKFRSTADNLAYFESHIMEAFAENEFFVSIFFDIEKFYDRIWRQLIIKALLKMGFKGNLVHFISNFLKNRTFVTMMGNKSSSIKTSQNGIQQGSVISCTLALIVLNSIFKRIKLPIKTIIYADDIVSFISHRDLGFIQNHLQEMLNEIAEWADKGSFKFSESKTVAMIFTHKRKNLYQPGLTFNGKSLKYVKQYKFLGINFDSKLNWTPHLKIVKARATRNLNLIKMLSHSHFGSDRKLLLRIHKMII